MKVPKPFQLYKGLASVFQYIKLNDGPISVAQYMKYVLTNPIDGYYHTRNVIGEKGDFITSPEISQIFGEIIGVWILNEWVTNIGQDTKLNIIELGPGLGTLTKDLQRVFSKFSATHGKVAFHLVESSPKMAALQASNISPNPNAASPAGYHHYPTRWYDWIGDVPRDLGTCCVIANEFFDVLPVHKYQKTADGWREIMVDVDVTGNNPKLIYKLGRAPFFPLEKLIKDDDSRDHVEVSLETGAILKHVTERLRSDGCGFGLICDYGHVGDKGDTFRAFKDHKLHNPLLDPGLADLTCDVDFDYCSRLLRSHTPKLGHNIPEKESLEPVINVFGPVSQGDFLNRCGGRLRLDMLLANLQIQNGGTDDVDKRKEELLSSYEYLTDDAHMGQRFKFLAFNYFPGSKKLVPPGFEPS